MEEKHVELLKTKCDEENYKKLMELNNPKLHNFIAKYVLFVFGNTSFW
ncbi:unnamed protein product, partial [marine sediment metagenome]